MKNRIVNKLNKKLLIASILSVALLSQTQAALLPSGTLLGIDQGVGSGANIPCTTGSCFGMEVAPGYIIWTDFGSGVDGGIVVGKNQVSGNQEVSSGLSNNLPGEVTNAWRLWDWNGTFYTPTGATDNIFNNTSCAGAACIGVTELGSWNWAMLGTSAQLGSANGCNSFSCSADQLAGIFITDYTITPSGNVATYSMNYGSVMPDRSSSGFDNVRFSLVLRGSIPIDLGPLFASFDVPAEIVLTRPAQFADTSSFFGGAAGTIVSWNWNFGDGNTSTVQSPLYSYANGGGYTVTLTVEDDQGNIDTVFQTVLVKPISMELSSLDGTNGFRLNGEALNDRVGISVSAAGDINGDGMGDLIIGAPFASPNGIESGASYVVFGSTQSFAAQFELSSLDGTNGFRINGEASYDSSGNSVSAAGDINGDGLGDLIIGAWGADPNGKSRSGASYVVFGSTQGFTAQFELSSLNGTNGFKLNGEALDDWSGSSVSAAGDINGDGLDDLIIGAYFADPNGGLSGASYVVFGNTQGFAVQFELSSLNGSNGFKLNGEAAGDRLGLRVSAAGDINGDGLGDIVVGAPSANISTGTSYVVFGSAQGFAAQFELSSLDGSNGFKLSGEVLGALLGTSVSAAGDINGDGLDDLIIGAHSADPNVRSFGVNYIIFGSTQGFAAQFALSSLDGTNGFKTNGEALDDHAGVSAAAGDINGDGIDDLVIGASFADPNGDLSGASYVVFGSTQGFAAQLSLLDLNGLNGFKLNGEAAGNNVGHSVSAIGDINGDGLGDFIIGAPNASPNGNASGAGYVVFGSSQVVPPPTPSPIPTPSPTPTPCVELYPLITVTMIGSGGISEIEDTLMTTFKGHVVATDTKGKIRVCSGTTVDYEVTSTVGIAICSIHNKAVNLQGTLTEGDKLVCTNKPDGTDTDRFKINRSSNKDVKEERRWFR